MRTVRLCLLGFGNVARAFCDLLERQEGTLAERHGLRVLVTAVGTRGGSLLVPEGLPAGVVRTAIGAAPAPPEPPLPATDLLAASRADILVELTVLERQGAPLATAHIERALVLGMDVVTANKGPIAWNWRRLSAATATTGRRLRFESTVMDGLPVFSLLELALPDCAVRGFEAVFNATTNFILDAASSGSTMAEALAQVKAQGYAEADPSHDLDGWDAATKAAALANVAMDAGITPADIEKQRLADIPPERTRSARAAGHRLRLVTTVGRDAHGAAYGAVRATELDIDHPLAALGGPSLGVILHTDLMGDVVVCERNALLPQTAYGVYADLLHLCKRS